MLVKSPGIILHTFKYGNSSVICKIFTREYGLLSFIFKGVSSSKGKIKSAHLMPLNIVDLNFYHHPVKNLKNAKEIACAPVLHSLRIEPDKRALGSFVQELLNRCISEEEVNTELFDLIHDSIIEIENSSKIPAWISHLFVLKLCQLLGNGIYSSDYKQGYFFSIKEGTFTKENDFQYCASEECSMQFYNLLHTENADLKFRRELLKVLIQFMQFHIIGHKPIYSLDIFSSIMS